MHNNDLELLYNYRAIFIVELHTLSLIGSGVLLVLKRVPHSPIGLGHITNITSIHGKCWGDVTYFNYCEK